MYDITKTRMLLTTAVFAAVAAVFAGGASARALAEDGSGIGAEPVAGVAATVDPLASSRLTGLLSSLSPQERSYLKSMTAVCSVVLCQPDEWLAARLGFATRAGSAPTPIAPVLDSSEATQGVSEWAVISRSDVVSRYVDNNRTRTGQQRVAPARPNKFPAGYRGLP